MDMNFNHPPVFPSNAVPAASVYHGNPRHLFPKVNSIEEDYIITDIALGVGVHGKVRKCLHRATGKPFALKVLDDKPRSRKEIDLHWRCCGHPNIVEIIDVYENYVNNSKKLFLVMEVMQGGELFERIQKKSHFTEHEASLLMRKITSAVRHIHSLNLAHRDLKPENLLFKDTTENSEIKLTDFGFAKESDGDALKTPCYTPYYVAPEILRAEAKSSATYDKSCDMWSLGVILYILLAGYPPFYSEGGLNISPGMKKRIRAGQYDFPDEEWGHISPSVIQLIKRLLHVDPAKRISIEEMWRHPWIAGTQEVPHTPLSTPKILQFDHANWSDTKEEMIQALATMRVEHGIQLKALPTAASALLARRQKD